MKTKTKKYYGYLFAIALLLTTPFISTKYFGGHDTLYHIKLIKLLREKLINFDFSPIVSTIANDFGYGTYIFYPKLPHYIATLVNLIVNNEFISIKITHFIVIFLSGIFMFKLINLITNKKGIALLGSVFYMTMPYFISDNFIRDSLNECFIFLFMPIILMGLVSLIKGDKNNFYIYFILGYIGMVNSHLVLSVFFTLPLLIFIIVNINKIINKENIKHLLLASLIILIMIMPSVIMLIEHKSLNLHTVFNDKIMKATVYNVKSNAVSKKAYLFMSSRSCSIYFFINFVVYIFFILGAIYIMFKEKNKNIKQIMISLILFLLFSVFLTTRHFPYQYMPKLLLSIQFPYRCLAFVNFSISIVAAYGLKWFKSMDKKIIPIASMICIIIGILCINSQAFIETKNIKAENDYGMGWQKEYLPLKTHSNQKYLKSRNKDVKIVFNEKVKTKIIENKTPYLKFKIDNVDKKTVVQLPRLYYLGYDIKLKTKNNKTKKLEYSQDKYGFIATNIKESGVVTVKYKGTLLYRLTKIIRLLLVIGIFVYLLLLKRRRYDRYKYNSSNI